MNSRNVLLTKTGTVPAYGKTTYVLDSDIRLDSILLDTSEPPNSFLT